MVKENIILLNCLLYIVIYEWKYLYVCFFWFFVIKILWLFFCFFLVIDVVYVIIEKR